MKLGINGYARSIPDPATDHDLPAHERIDQLLAGRVGRGVAGVGEHHQAELLNSAQTVILATADEYDPPHERRHRLDRH